MVLPKIRLCNVSLLISYWEWDETRRCFMNFMLLLLLLDNSLNISRLLKITAKTTNLGACCKNCSFVQTMPNQWEKAENRCVCVYKYLKTVHTRSWLSQTTVLISWWIGPTEGKSIILFRLAGCPELKMKENVSARAPGLWVFEEPGALGAGTQHSPFPQPEETALQADVLWGMNQTNHTSVI